MNTQKTAEKLGWMVLDPKTWRSDGWYATRELAERQFAFWRQELPDRFLLLAGAVRDDSRPSFPKLFDDPEWRAQGKRAAAMLAAGQEPSA